MHKDQKRIRGALLPHILDRVISEDAAAERDCTVLNRLFLQGPDPLFLSETCPAEVAVLCNRLRTSYLDGVAAIERAHWQGPGVLLQGTGFPDNLFGPEGDDVVIEQAWRLEALWLVLAFVSDTTEEDYKPEVTLTERVRRAMSSGTKLALLAHAHLPTSDLWSVAMDARRKFEAACVWVGDANGIPVCEEDAGFYIGYRKGWKVCGVRHGDKVFYGTVPGTTLDEQGVKVDEKVSESYGFVRVRE